MLGSRPRLQWVELNNRIAATITSWGNYVCHHNNSQLDVTMCWGFRPMFEAIQLSFGNFLVNWSPCFVHVWFGNFTPVGVMIGAKGTTSLQEIVTISMYLRKDDYGKLMWNRQFGKR